MKKVKLLSGRYRHDLTPIRFVFRIKKMLVEDEQKNLLSRYLKHRFEKRAIRDSRDNYSRVLVDKQQQKQQL